MSVKVNILPLETQGFADSQAEGERDSIEGFMAMPLDGPEEPSHFCL
jgi:hypothetical protein